MRMNDPQDVDTRRARTIIDFMGAERVETVDDAGSVPLYSHERITVQQA